MTADNSAPRRLLLISYHFPPSTAVGGLRWEKLSKLLAENGYEFDVIACTPDVSAAVDWARANSFPPTIRTHFIPDNAPILNRMVSAFARWTSGLRARRSASAFVGARSAESEPSDAQPSAPTSLLSDVRSHPRKSLNAWLSAHHGIAWANRAQATARRLAESNTFSAVVTSGPPHYAHVAGHRLSEQTGIPHVADFRDPWSLAEYVIADLECPLFHRLADRHERDVVFSASAIVMNTEAAAVGMRARYPQSTEKIHFVMNGSDAEDRVSSPSRERFTLLYAGSLYLHRDPRVLFRACEPLVRELSLTPEQFAIEFFGPTGSYGGVSIEDLASSYGLKEHVQWGGMVDRHAAMAAAASASQLVCLPDGQHFTIPAKLFEYVQLDTWLLVFAEPTSAIAVALSGLDADVIAPDNTEAAAALIRRRWERFQAGERPKAIDRDGRFGRTAQASRFESILRSIMHGVRER